VAKIAFEQATVVIQCKRRFRVELNYYLKQGTRFLQVNLFKTIEIIASAWDGKLSVANLAGDAKS
jgi:hypothetical protein